jgi:DtxR family Mn-dependent transcriptional regulator
MIKRLEAEGLVRMDGSVIVLTSEGQQIAQAVVRRHRLAERFLTDVLGLSWAEAHHEAGKWEHVISPVVEEALDRFLDAPTTCPHGNPIPGSDYQPPKSQSLSEIVVGAGFTVSRITEELEFADGMLEFLEESTLMPGFTGEVTAVSPDGTVTVVIGNQHVGVGSYAAERILVLA